MIIDRLVRACTTGERCRQSRGVDAISRKGLALLAEHQLWREAAETIIAIDAIHPTSQLRFVRAWSLASFGKFIDDDDLFFAFLRKVMPAYTGGDEFMYRGQLAGDRIGSSWTLTPHIALKFALFGDQNVDPLALALNGRARKSPREGAIMLKGLVPAERIICAPYLMNGLEAECIIDPRGVEFESQPASEAFGWVKEQALETLDTFSILVAVVAQIAERNDAGDEPINETLVRAAYAGDENAQALIDGGLLDGPIMARQWDRLARAVSKRLSGPLNVFPCGLRIVDGDYSPL